MGQGPEPVDVTDRPQPFAGAQLRVDGDPVVVGFDPDGLQAEAADARPPASGNEQTVAADVLASVEPEDEVVTVAPRRRHLRVEDESDVFAAQDLAQRVRPTTRPRGRVPARRHR